MSSQDGKAVHDTEIDELIARSAKVFDDAREAMRDRSVLNRQFDQLHAELRAVIDNSNDLAERFRARLVAARKVPE